MKENLNKRKHHFTDPKVYFVKTLVNNGSTSLCKNIHSLIHGHQYRRYDLSIKIHYERFMR